MKKFIISSDTLKPILAHLEQAIPKKPQMPELENILFKVKENEVELITSDLELTILYTCEAEVTGGTFEALIPFDFVKRVVALCKSVPLAFDINGNKVTITGQNDIYELRGLTKAKDYPNLPDMPKQNFISMNGDFIEWLNKAMLTVGTDEQRPAMTNILLDIFPGQLTMTSTDAHVLFKRDFKVEAKAPEQLLIRPKIAKALNGFTSTTVYWRKSHIAFQSEQITVIATRPDLKYPDYKVVIPTTEKNLLLDKDALVMALKKCALTTSTQKFTNIFFKREKGTVVFEAEDLDMNRKIDVDIPGNLQGDVEKISVNADKFLDVLDQVDYDKVHLHISAPSKAILITAENDPDYTGMIMPISN